ncbi:uncharacterized protein LOC129222650 [Uloborus diversus]|uniref:uncharacterized protein LOC129222650 n=1 Tax=Uloborus diversus TaxID=327109 RepID=UPI00240966B6|nr:uncharacterized protein LOC129222650 [Uloborus diversus]
MILVSSGKVKDRVQHFDDMEKRKNTKRCLSPLPDKENRISKGQEIEDNISISVLDPKLKKEWFVKAAQCDYHALVSLLKKEPKLAGIKVNVSITALHWAAKQGDANVVKLISGAYKVNPNVRSGYTPVHLATLYKHDMIVHLLVHTYGADPSIRDYSGKRADQYPDNHVRTVSGVKTMERKPLKTRPLEKEPSSGFIRIGSLNLRKSRKSAVFASVRGSTRSWGSATELRLSNYMSTRKKTPKIQIEKKCETEVKNDSDSDSAYGFNSK